MAYSCNTYGEPCCSYKLTESIQEAARIAKFTLLELAKSTALTFDLFREKVCRNRLSLPFTALATRLTARVFFAFYPLTIRAVAVVFRWRSSRTR